MELAIDTAGPVAGLALSREGALLADLAWHVRTSHAAELLPALTQLLERAGAAQRDLRAVFVCRGPGSYAGLRVGISTAMGLAYALDVDVLGVGRLEADAYVHAAYPGPVVAVHAAGRGDLAWAAYEGNGDWRELMPPRLGRVEALVTAAPHGALICGEVDAALAELLSRQRPDVRVFAGPAHQRRAAMIAALAWPRFAAGARDNRYALEPLYLREPHITAGRTAHGAPQ